MGAWDLYNVKVPNFLQKKRKRRKDPKMKRNH